MSRNGLKMRSAALLKKEDNLAEFRLELPGSSGVEEKSERMVNVSSRAPDFTLRDGEAEAATIVESSSAEMNDSQLSSLLLSIMLRLPVIQPRSIIEVAL